MIHWIKKKFVTVMELRDDKRSIAAGVAVGFFWGFTPLIGLKTLLSLFTAWLLRVNKIAAVVAVSLHDLFIPLYYPYLVASYHLGNWILGNDHPPRFRWVIKLLALPPIDIPDDWWHRPSTFFAFLRDVTEGYWMNLYDNAHYVCPVILGSVLLAMPLAIGAYFLTVWAIEKTALRSLARLDAKLHPTETKPSCPPLQDDDRLRHQQQRQQQQGKRDQ